MSTIGQQRCGCSRHDEFVKGQEFSLKKIDQRPFRKSIIDTLISNGILSAKAKYLCNVCAEEGNKLIGSNITEKPAAKRMKLNAFDIVIEEIESGKATENNMCNLATALGASQRVAFANEAINVTDSYKTNLKNYDPFTFDTNIIVLSFLSALVGIGNVHQCESKTRVMSLRAAIDCLLATTNICTITPLFFVLNLIMYFISGSKTVVNLLSSLSPAGCYSSVMNWFRSITTDKIVCPQNSDIVTFFDNNQVLARNWRVRFDSKALLSVITSVIHIEQCNPTRYQYESELDPKSWLYNTELNNVQIVERVKNYIKYSAVIISTQRNKFLCERLNKVYLEHNSECSDIVDNLIHDPNFVITKDKTNSDIYSFLEHSHPNKPPKVSLGEPSLCNPCSYEKVNEVLQDLLSNISVGNERKWSVIGCDGLPYILASRLIDQNPALQNILLQPGLGHYEINMTKSCFKLLWDVVLADLANMLGYKSIKAQVACRNANDHHKSWQILQILLYGTTDELLVPYIRYCISEKLKPSVSGYHTWLEKCMNPNYIFMCTVIFQYVFSLFLFWAAVRRNNSEVMLAARTKFASLFYGLNQTSYQEIDYRDLKMRVLAPENILLFLRQNESFSVSGHPSKGEGGDFILENKNKRLKRLIPVGLPTEARWLKACRSFDTLDAIRSNINNALETENSDGDYIHHVDLSLETMQWRQRIRNTRYFESPLEKMVHISISSQTLDEELVKFYENAKANRETYLQDISDGQSPGKGQTLTPIFITKGEREKFCSIKNKTKEQIKTYVMREIDQIRELGGGQEADALMATWNRKIKTQTKDNYILFYKSEVLVALDDMMNEHPVLGDEENEKEADF